MRLYDYLFHVSEGRASKFKFFFEKVLCPTSYSSPCIDLCTLLSPPHVQSHVLSHNQSLAQPYYVASCPTPSPTHVHAHIQPIPRSISSPMPIFMPNPSFMPSPQPPLLRFFTNKSRKNGYL